MARLAKLSGVSQSYISLLEKGERGPSVEKLLSICKGLGITMGEFENSLRGFDIQNMFLSEDNSPLYMRLCYLARTLTNEEIKLVIKLMEELSKDRIVYMSERVESPNIE